jgi:hypothetical protein
MHMPSFTPGQFRKSLQEKIKNNPDAVAQEEEPLRIKNTDPATFARPVSTYAGSEMKQINESVHNPTGTAALPKNSIMQKPVHELMKAFVKQQYGQK